MMGISEKDFDQLRHKEEIRSLFSNIGYRYKPGKFEGIFMRAEKLVRNIKVNFMLNFCLVQFSPRGYGFCSRIY